MEDDLRWFKSLKSSKYDVSNTKNHRLEINKTTEQTKPCILEWAGRTTPSCSPAGTWPRRTPWSRSASPPASTTSSRTGDPPSPPSRCPATPPTSPTWSRGGREARRTAPARSAAPSSCSRWGWAGAPAGCSPPIRRSPCVKFSFSAKSCVCVWGMVSVFGENFFWCELRIRVIKVLYG